ncbi:MAG TPA: NAD-dependent epimerase/dehydratase family protein [Pirellulales bacterium]|nr:NAD-dependent epimerase/dehydratase family protein [Pirellulales bacterium]
MSTCLITGGAGNLARGVCPLLAGRFDRLVLFDQKPIDRLSAPAEFQIGDLTDAARLEALFAEYRPDAVVHLASLLSGSSERDRARGWHVNATGTFLMLETALRHGARTFLFASTVAAFGGNLPDPLTDDAPQWPDGLYGVTKVACERLGVYYHHRHGVDFRCLRLPIIISPFAPPGAASAFASQVFVEAARHGRFTFRVRPETRLALIYYRDAVRAMASLLLASDERLTQRVYNIHGMTATPRELADAVVRRLPNADLQFEPDSAVADLLASWPGAIDDSRARTDWDWEPQFDLERTSDHMLDEVRQLPSP